ALQRAAAVVADDQAIAALPHGHLAKVRDPNAAFAATLERDADLGARLASVRGYGRQSLVELGFQGGIVEAHFLELVERRTHQAGARGERNERTLGLLWLLHPLDADDAARDAA